MTSKRRVLIKARSNWIAIIFLLLYMAIAGRLLYVQVLHSEKYEKWAKNIRSREIVEPASRGTIFDRTGRELAVDVETVSVYANTREIVKPSQTAVRVAALLGVDNRTLEQKLTGKKHFVWLGRQVDPRIGKHIYTNRNELPGVGSQRDSKRIYPQGELAAQILGFTDIDNKGVEGIEGTKNALLKGINGLTKTEVDIRTRSIPETRRVLSVAKNGKSIYLTLDVSIQHIAEMALAKMGKVYKPRYACAIVMNPHTGEILALANYPSYDPNKARSVDEKLWRNRAVADLYEPGSTIKAITVAAALNEGFSPNTVVARCTGRDRVKGGAIPCVLHHPYEKGHGAVDMGMIIRQSCNIGAAHTAMKLGRDKLFEYEKKFGLFDRPHIGFGCEAASWTPNPKNWRLIQVANIGFGQGIVATPLKMASVYCTIANGGVLVEPQIIKEIRNADGSIYQPFKVKKLRRVISEETAEKISKLLVDCVVDGTGKTAGIDGRSVAGKTGSAQIPKEKGRGYESGQYIASFMGFAPADKPELVIAVVVNRPQGSHWGATVASPVFKEIGEKALWYLKVPSAPLEKNFVKKKTVVSKKPLA